MKLSDYQTLPRAWRIAAWLAVLLIVLLAVWLGRRLQLRVSEQQVREHVIATVQREARESFFVTGSLDITATTTIENTRVLLPNLLDLKLGGTSRATVQVPGRAYYGFDVRNLAEKDIQLSGDTVQIVVPAPVVLAVEPNLEQMKVWSTQGWLRSPASVRSAEHSGLRSVQEALRKQASEHVATSAQPHVNTAHALQRQLEPVLKALGLRNPVFRFRIGNDLILQ